MYYIIALEGKEVIMKGTFKSGVILELLFTAGIVVAEYWLASKDDDCEEEGEE